MQFPEYRARRSRRSPNLRRLVRETDLRPSDMILPLFVGEGSGQEIAIDGLPGQLRYSADRLTGPAQRAARLGIPGVLLFGVPDRKDNEAKEALREDGVVPRAVQAIKEAAPELVVATDVCLCAYTTHGHCGIVQGNSVRNDETLEVLSEMAILHAKAGADLVAPSDMMDGRVGFIRESLDEEECDQVGIMAYSAKYASAYYGPFRGAVESTPQFGDRSTYQMDPANAREALREVMLDVEEGADIVMIKPALAYLDIIARIRDEFELPIAAYNVSGEYAMLKAAEERGWIDGPRVMMENLTAMRRAGADMIITYHALEAAELLGG